MSELLPCPFCGGDEMTVIESNTERFGDRVPIIDCDNCGACGPYEPTARRGCTEAEAVEAWNRRATPAPVAQEPWDDPVDDAIMAAAEAAQPEPDAPVERNDLADLLAVWNDRDLQPVECNAMRPRITAALVALQQRVRGLERRLEIPQEPFAHLDGIECRDETIKQQDAVITRLESQRASAEAELAQARNTLADINDALRIALADDIEGMERERIEDLARELAQARKVIAAADVVMRKLDDAVDVWRWMDEMGAYDLAKKDYDAARAQVGKGEGEK